MIVLAFLGEALILLVVLALVCALINYISIKITGDTFDPFNVQESDSDFMKAVKTVDNYKWATRNGKSLENFYNNVTGDKK